MKKYSVVGGNYFRSYHGTGTFTCLKILGTCDTEEEVKALVEAKFEDCGGLILVVDLTTGEESTV